MRYLIRERFFRLGASSECKFIIVDVTNASKPGPTK